MLDMMKMMGKVKEMQEKIKLAQENLGKITVEGESGAGLVKAVSNGKKEIIRLEIDSSIQGADDHEVMKDLIIAAVNKALVAADEKAKEAMKGATEGMIPGIPGLDLNGLI